MNQLTDVEKALRRVRKKLRQAQYLEGLQRPLTVEEKQKVALLSEYQETICHILSNLSNESSQSNVNNDVIEPHSSVTRDIIANYITNDHLDKHTKASADDPCKVEEIKTVNSESVHVSEIIVQQKPEYVKPTPKSTKIDESQSSVKVPTSNSDKMAEKLKRLHFEVRDLQGHNDIIYDISVADDLIATASRDCLVKVWDSSSGQCIHSLSSHTESVTAVMLYSHKESSYILSKQMRYVHLIDKDAVHILLSGGQDSHIRIWSLPHERELYSIYTFNPISQLSRITEMGQTTSLLTLTFVGTASGRVEIWQCWPAEFHGDAQLENHIMDDFSPKMLYGESHYSSAVVSLQTMTPSMSVNRDKTQCRVVSADNDGGIRLIEFTFCFVEDDATKLLCQNVLISFRNESLHHCTNEPARRRSIQLSELTSTVLLDKDHLLIGDSSTHLKVVDFTSSEVQMVAPACIDVTTAEFNMTQVVANLECFPSILSSGDMTTAEKCTLVAATALDVDNCCEYINFYEFNDNSIQHGTSSEKKKSLRYIGSLVSRERKIGRVLALNSFNRNKHSLMLVTGGSNLLVWEANLSEKKTARDPCVEVLQMETLRISPIETHSTHFDDEDEDESNSDLELEDSCQTLQPSSTWRWLCSLL